jgi:hypothetical protein
MKRTNLAKIVVISLLIAMLCVEGFADIRVRFARGRTSATMTGKISNGGRICYVAGAKRGQTLTATVSSSTGRVQIFESGDTSYTSDIEYSGDQSVCVDNLGRATSYTLTVSIR